MMVTTPSFCKFDKDSKKSKDVFINELIKRVFPPELLYKNQKLKKTFSQQLSDNITNEFFSCLYLDHIFLGIFIGTFKVTTFV